MATLSRALAASLLLPALALADTSRVGVIAVGGDPVAAGALQQRIDRALAANRSLVAVPQAEIALRLGAGSAPTRDDGRLAALFAQAKEAYFDDRLVEASERVEEAARLIDAGLAVPGSDRVTVLTWRTALALAMKEEAKATEHAKLLLELAPDAQPDLDLFRPSVGKLIDQVRTTRPRAVEVKVEGAPAGARLEVDGRLVDARFRIGPGKHALAMRAPGFRTASFPFDAPSDHVLVLTPALDPGDKALFSLQLAVWADGAVPALTELGKRLSLDAVAVVAARPDGAMRAVLIRRAEAPRRSDVLSPANNPEADLASWLASVLAPSAKPNSTPSTSRVAATRGAAWTLDAGLAISQRSRALEASGGAGFDAAFTGVGGFADGEAWYRAFVVGLRGSWTSYDLSTATFSLPDGSEGSVGGGQTQRADLRAGGRVLGSPDSWGLIALVEGVWETHRAQDLHDDQGDLGFFASYDRIAAGVGIRGVASIASVRVHAGASVHPFHRWVESSGKTGRNPAGEPAFGLRAGAAMPVARAWEMQTEYSGEMRRAGFEGAADAPVDPAIDDATISEMVHSLSLTLRRRF